MDTVETGEAFAWAAVLPLVGGGFNRTVFLDVRTDPTENVWPMVQAGKGISEMLLGSEDL